MSIYADEGTAAHQVLEECLRMQYEVGVPMPAVAYIGNIRRIEDGPHGRLSPSGAKRWMTCSGSPAMEALFPETPEGPREIEVTAGMASAVQVALDYVEMRCGELRALFGPAAVVEVIPERRVSPYAMLSTHDCDGTSDITILVTVDGNVEYLEQADYKHGAGVPVSAHDPQNDFYLLGSLCAENTLTTAALLARGARCTIIQPRCGKIEPRVRWRDIDDVGAWVDGFREKAIEAIGKVKEADDHNNQIARQDVDGLSDFLVASEDGCRFCNAKGACAEYTRFALASIGIMDDGTPLPTDGGALYEPCEDFARRDNRLLTTGQTIAVLMAKDILIGALQAVEAYTQQTLEDGTASQEIKNHFKLVAKRTRQTWGIKDEPELLRRLKRLKGIDSKTGKLRGLGKKDIYVTKFDSVAGVERSLKAMTAEPTVMRAFRELLYKPDGDVVIAPISDPRDPVDVGPTRPEDAFADAPVAASAPPTPAERENA